MIKLDEDFTMDFSANIDADSLFDTLVSGVSTIPNAYNITIQKLVPIRKHKKKRIAKKWAKKYGYKYMPTQIKGWKMRNNTDGSIEFIKENERKDKNDK